MATEGTLESTGVFTLSRAQAAEKLQAHLQTSPFSVYVAIIQWLVGLGCSRAVVDLAKGYCLISAITPKKTLFRNGQSKIWPTF